MTSRLVSHSLTDCQFYCNQIALMIYGFQMECCQSILKIYLIIKASAV